MPIGVRIPGSTTTGQIEKLLRDLELTLGAGRQALSGEAYWDTLRAFALSVPFTENDGDMSEEEESAFLSRIIGCDKKTFVQRIDSRLKQRSRQFAREQAAKKKLRGK
jgi:hypothetical protein